MGESMIESMAIAIYGAAYRGDRENKLTGQRFPEPGWCWERAGEVQQAFARSQASAAIADLESSGYVIVPREPTEAMVRAAYTAADAAGGHLDETDVWREMIDKALTPKGPTP